MLPLSTAPQTSLLLRLRFRVTRLLQRSETFGFDDLALLLLLGAHDVGLLERGLYDAAKKSVINRRNDTKVIDKVNQLKTRVTAYLLGWCHCFEKIDGLGFFLLVIER